MERVQVFDSDASGPAGLSRRSAVLRLGGGGLAVLLVSGVFSAAAQEASPAAGAAGGDYLAIREYQLAPGRTMAELTAAVEGGFVPILNEVPGFQQYFLVETGDSVISISVFLDEAGAEESTRRAADWVGENLAGMFAGPPVVTTGSVWLHSAGGAVSGTPTP